MPGIVCAKPRRSAQLADGAARGRAQAIGYAIPAGSALTLVDPAGGLAVQQKVLPLNKPLDKLGEARIDGDKRFDLSSRARGWSG